MQHLAAHEDAHALLVAGLGGLTPENAQTRRFLELSPSTYRLLICGDVGR